MSDYYGADYGFRPMGAYRGGPPEGGPPPNPYSSFPSGGLSQPSWNDGSQGFDGRGEMCRPGEFDERSGGRFGGPMGGQFSEPYTGQRFDFDAGRDPDWGEPRFGNIPQFDQRLAERGDDTWRSSNPAQDSWRSGQLGPPGAAGNFERGRRPFFDREQSPRMRRRERSRSPVRRHRGGERTPRSRDDRDYGHGAGSKHRDADSRSRDRSHGHSSSSHSRVSESRKAETGPPTKKTKGELNVDQDKAKEVAANSDEKNSADTNEHQDAAGTIKAEVSSEFRDVEENRETTDEKLKTQEDKKTAEAEHIIPAEHKKSEGAGSAPKIVIRKDFTHDDIHHFKPIAISSAYPKGRKSANVPKASETVKLPRASEKSSELPTRVESVHRDDSAAARRIASPVLTSPVLDPQQYVEELSNPDLVDPPQIQDLASELMPKRRVKKETEDDWKMEGGKKTLLGAPPRDVHPVEEPRIGEFGFFTGPVNAGPSKMHVNPHYATVEEPRRPVKPGLLDSVPPSKRFYEETYREPTSPQRPFKPGLLGFQPNDNSSARIAQGPPQRPPEPISRSHLPSESASRVRRSSEGLPDSLAAVASSLAQSDIVAEVAKKGIADILLSNETLKAKIAELYSEEIKKLLTKGIDDGGKREEPRSAGGKGILSPPRTPRQPYDGRGGDEPQRDVDEGRGPARASAVGPTRGALDAAGGANEFEDSGHSIGYGRGGDVGVRGDALSAGGWESEPANRSNDFDRGSYRGPQEEFRNPPAEFLSPGGRRDSFERSWGAPNGSNFEGPPRDRSFDGGARAPMGDRFDAALGPPGRLEAPGGFDGPPSRFDGPGGGFEGPRNRGNRFDGPPQFDRPNDFERHRGGPPGGFDGPFGPPGGGFDGPNGQFPDGYGGPGGNFGGAPGGPPGGGPGGPPGGGPGGPPGGGAFDGNNYSRDFMGGPGPHAYTDDRGLFGPGPQGPEFRQRDSWKFREGNFGRREGREGFSETSPRFGGRGRRI